MKTFVGVVRCLSVLLVAVGAGATQVILAADIAQLTPQPKYERPLPDGRIPIRGPVTISQPGHYVLTGNVVSADQVVVWVDHADGVHIDLNGFTIESTYESSFDDQGYAVAANRSDRLVLRNGTTKNSRINFANSDGVVAEDLQIIESFIETVGSTPGIALRRNMIRNSPRWGIRCMSCDGAEITSNRIAGTGDDGISCVGSGVNIADNTVSQAGDNGISVFGSSSRLVGNVVTDALMSGIDLNGEGWRVSNNVSGGAGEQGLWLRGERHHVDGNLLVGNGQVGFLMIVDAAHNVYRGNTARGNDASAGGYPDFLDLGTDNTSHGDNYMPDQR